MSCGHGAPAGRTGFPADGWRVQGAAADCQIEELTAALDAENRRLQQRLAQRSATIEVRAGVTRLVPAGGLLLPTGHDRLEGSAHEIDFISELMTKYFTGNRLNRYQIFLKIIIQQKLCQFTLNLRT